MQCNYINPETDVSYLFGIDRFGGLFITISSETRENFTQFHPFHHRLTYDAVTSTIPTVDLKELKKEEIGHFKVYFSLGTTESYNGDLPEVLVKHYKGEHDFEVKTFGDCLELLRYFNEDIFFFDMTFMDEENLSFTPKYEFINDVIPV